MDAFDECIALARKMGLHVKSKPAYAHVCALCKHSSSGHGLLDDGDLRAGPYRCPCGCEIPQDSPGFWLSAHDYNDWKGAFPVVVKLH